MPREARLALPDAPGIYRMLRTSGDVLYVGKASSLRHRVNSYFRKQRGIHERTLEMLSQARDLSFEVTPTTLEAALLEPDEIKRHCPPYNVALTVADRALWFTPPDLSERSPHPSSRCPVGPFPSAETLDQFRALAALAKASAGQGPAALARNRWAPDPAVFDAGYARFCAAHAELSRVDLGACSRLLRLGTRLWHEGRRDHDGETDDDATGVVPAWTPEQVQLSLEWLVLRAALARRRARWLTRLAESTVVWNEPGADGARLLVIENGDVVVRTTMSPCASPPVPPGHRRPITDRHDAFTIARYDRLRVLTTELKRLVAEGAPIGVRFGEAAPLSGARLAYALSWV
jgi:DNA polymerase-3 subunit epsilon